MSDRKFFIIIWAIAMVILIGGLLTIKHRYEHIVNTPTNVKAIAK